MRKRLLLLCLVIGWMTVWVPPAIAAFRLERADGSRPAKGINLASYVTGTRTYSLDVGALRVARPKPRLVAAVRPVATRSNDSSNPYVDPWGCEARHAQQWNPSGKYWGKYQFDRQTWAAHGGTNYGSASEAEQDAVAARVKYDAWPNC